jgi:hypothetical protein
VTVTIPIKLPSLANARVHWRVLSQIKKSQKAMTAACLVGLDLPPLPAVVTITRLGPRKLDGDNLQAAAKYVRDSIAAAYGVDDGSDLYDWQYKQRTSKNYAAVVEIVSAPPATARRAG